MSDDILREDDEIIFRELLSNKLPISVTYLQRKYKISYSKAQSWINIYNERKKGYFKKKKLEWMSVKNKLPNHELYDMNLLLLCEEETQYHVKKRFVHEGRFSPSTGWEYASGLITNCRPYVVAWMVKPDDSMISVDYKM